MGGSERGSEGWRRRPGVGGCRLGGPEGRVYCLDYHQMHPVMCGTGTLVNKPHTGTRPLDLDKWKLECRCKRNAYLGHEY